jgi:hypothetical protein
VQCSDVDNEVTQARHFGDQSGAAGDRECSAGDWGYIGGEMQGVEGRRTGEGYKQGGGMDVGLGWGALHPDQRMGRTGSQLQIGRMELRLD